MLFYADNFSEEEIDAVMAFLHAVKLRRKWKPTVLSASPTKLAQQKIMKEDTYAWEVQGAGDDAKSEGQDSEGAAESEAKGEESFNEGDVVGSGEE